MGDLKSRLKPLFRRSSTFSSTATKSSDSSPSEAPGDGRTWSKSSLRLAKNKKPSFTIPVYEENQLPPHLPPVSKRGESYPKGDQEHTPDTSPGTPRSPQLDKQCPVLTLEEPTPVLPARTGSSAGLEALSPGEPGYLAAADVGSDIGSQRPEVAARRRSLTSSSQSRSISTSLQSDRPQSKSASTDYFGEAVKMKHRKMWVKRPGASATQVTIKEDDLVDDVRDMILRKYANSLGRNFDSPDVTLKIISRNHSSRSSNQEHTLGPEESISKVLDFYYVDGQLVDEALIIEVPQRRTPKHSPRMAMPYYIHDDLRPLENGTDYFPPMPLVGQNSPHLPTSISVQSGHGGSLHSQPHSMAVLTTGQLPNLPSPGSRMPRHSHRPKYGRQHTSSPTVLAGVSNSQTHENLKAVNPPPMLTPPIPEEIQSHKAATPPARTLSPRPKPNKRSKKPVQHTPQLSGLLDGAVPPINVLIVEDNIINLRLLEAFMKRLKVRWNTAMNGKDAVTKWREGGFHLVLMDIQLPVMNGLEATKEIRRLERVNNIGVFSNSASSTPTFPNGNGLEGAVGGEDTLTNTAMFKSPVIIVALTASSLQSDRHEALAAGCNDFLTKPVNFEWLTRKVMEWGCMQALIDFDGWRKWKDFSQTKPADAEKKVASNNNAKSPKGALNGKVQGALKNTLKKDRIMSLNLGKENGTVSGSDGTGTGTEENGDSGSGGDVAGVKIRGVAGQA